MACETRVCEMENLRRVRWGYYASSDHTVVMQLLEDEGKLSYRHGHLELDLAFSVAKVGAGNPVIAFDAYSGATRIPTIEELEDLGAHLSQLALELGGYGFVSSLIMRRESDLG